MWGWLVVMTVAAVALYYLYSKKKGQQGTQGYSAAPEVVIQEQGTPQPRPPHEPRPRHKKHPPKHHRHPKRHDPRDWDKGDPGYDAYQAYLREHGRPPPHGRIPPEQADSGSMHHRHNSTMMQPVAGEVEPDMQQVPQPLEPSGAPAPAGGAAPGYGQTFPAGPGG